MRAFLAFDISQEVIERLAALQSEIRDTRADVGVVGRDNLHFTVKFLGEIPDDAVREIDGRIGALDLPAFEVNMQGVGMFPDFRRPRIVWAGVSPNDERAMTDTAEAVIEALDGIGKPEERGFRAHVTVGRVRSSRNMERLIALARENATREFGRTPVTSLKLKSSLLTPSGPVYSDVREYVLRR
jgi:2'-5' RNA ligase